VWVSWRLSDHSELTAIALVAAFLGTPAILHHYPRPTGRCSMSSDGGLFVDNAGLLTVSVSGLAAQMETHVEFRSNRFPPYDSEDFEVNPGRYGKRLAEFLQHGLNAKGFQTDIPVAEDWGWVVPIRKVGFRLWVGCGNYDAYPDDGFLCFIEPHTQTIRKLFWRIDISDHVSKLRVAIDELLSAEPGIRDKRWWSYDEFMHPVTHS
jgi:hypothetical protein